MEREPEDDFVEQDTGPEEEERADYFEEEEPEPEERSVEFKLDPESFARTLTVRPSRAIVQTPEEELPSGPTCKYFAPGASLIDTMHASAGENWPYDTLFESHGCCHPGRNRNGRLTCDAYMCMPACQYYEEETGSLLQGKQSDDVQVLLRKRRTGLGIPSYEVLQVHGTTETTVASYDDHATEGQAESRATAAYEKEIAERNLGDAVDIEVATFEIPSYLKSLVAEHA